MENNKYKITIDENKDKLFKLNYFTENDIERCRGLSIENDINSFKNSIITNNIENRTLELLLRKINTL